jgi:adenylate kinase
MLNIILFGGPGAGKGTQAALLKERYGLVHISTGEILRNEIAQSTAIGQAVQSLLDKGMYASDEIIAQIISSKIAQNIHSKGFIFDGIPRTIPQAQTLDRLLMDNGLFVDATLSLDTPEDELVTRILNRAKISGRADDRNENIIRQRIRIYHEKTEPLIDFYQAQKKYFAVNGLGSREEIFGNLCKAIDTL